MNKTKYIISLTVMLLGSSIMHVSAAKVSGAKEMLIAVNDTVDDIDEEEYLASKDPAKMSRINRAQQEGQLNARDYIIEDRFRPSGDKFVSNSFWDHFYIMSGFGLEKISSIENFRLGKIETAHLGIGKNFDEYNTVRLYGTVENGWRHAGNNSSRFVMANVSMDYMYNLSSYFAGYNPQRPVNVSAFGGIGVGVTRSKYAKWDWLADKMTGYKFAANAHFGLSFAIYGGPRSYLAIEPYIGVATDQMDNSYKRNWHKYDIYYGVRGTYSYYLRDNIGQEAWDRIHSSWHYAGLTDVEKLRVWQNPYFFEFQAGPSFHDSGHNMSVSAGKWFSPAFGMRYGVVGRNATYATKNFGSNGEYKLSNRNIYAGFRVEGIVNPFGFGKYYDWNKKFGAYLLGGFSIGRFQAYNYTKRISNSNVINIEGGVHAWVGLDQGVQFFIEPHATRYEGHLTNVQRYDADINFGFTVTSEARKYRDTYLPEEMPIYPTPQSRLTLGVGMSYLQRQQMCYAYDGKQSNSPLSGFSLFGEYRMNDYYSLRAGLEYLNMSDVTGPSPSLSTAAYAKSKVNVVNHASHMILFNLDPVLHLTSLMRGIYPYRKWDVDGAFGLTGSWYSGETASWIKQNKENSSLPKAESTMKIGLNANIRLSYHFTNQASIYFMPTAYVLKNVKYGNPTPKVKGWQMFETFQLGLQYALAPSKRLSSFEDSLDIERWRDPLFFEASSGICMAPADNQNGDGTTKMGIGYETSISIGKWFAPIAGFRATVTRRSTEWGFYNWNDDANWERFSAQSKDKTEFFNENYLGARFDLLINPMGFFRDFTWDDNWGVYGFLGVGYGQKRMHRFMSGATVNGKVIDDNSHGNLLKQPVTSINLGIHPWIKLSDDLSMFLEYMYATSNSQRKDGEYTNWIFDDSKQVRHTIKLGFAMQLRTKKYDEMRDLSAMYDFKPWLSSRLRFGIAGGINMVHTYRGHTSETSGIKGFITGFNGMAFGEYRISEYFAGRLTYEYAGRGDMQQSSNCGVGLLSASFNANLTTLLGGFRPRTTELDAFIGPTVFFQDGAKIMRNDGNAIAKDCSIGGHVGIRVSRTVADHTCVFLQPTIYILNRGGQDNFIGKFTLMQTINLGIHYTLW